MTKRSATVSGVGQKCFSSTDKSERGVEQGVGVRMGVGEMGLF